MNDSHNELERAEGTTEKADNSADGPGDLVVGLVTFIVFIIFMIGWMYFMA